MLTLIFPIICFSIFDSWFSPSLTRLVLRPVFWHKPLDWEAAVRMAIASSTVLALVALGAVYLIIQLSRGKKNELPLPPGPKGLPLVGNLADLPKPGDLEYEHWLKHKDLYGPLSSITVLGNTFVIINDAKLAQKLLGERSELHSARPFMYFCCKMYVPLDGSIWTIADLVQDWLDEAYGNVRLYRQIPWHAQEYGQSRW